MILKINATVKQNAILFKNDSKFSYPFTTESDMQLR